MTNTTIEDDLLRLVRGLPVDLQRRVRDFAEAQVITELRIPGSPSALLEAVQQWDPLAAAALADQIKEDRAREAVRHRAG